MEEQENIPYISNWTKELRKNLLELVQNLVSASEKIEETAQQIKNFAQCESCCLDEFKGYCLGGMSKELSLAQTELESARKKIEILKVYL